MSLNKNSSVAELRSELDRKRNRTLDLQTNTKDPDEWNNLNDIRWELEDLDNDLYLSQFIKNNEKLEKLIGEIEQSGEGARKIVATLNDAKKTLMRARDGLKKASAMFGELDNFYKETEALLKTLQNKDA